MKALNLPEEITRHLPDGYEPKQGCWLVLPEADKGRDGIATLNTWLRSQPWFPPTLRTIVWFGDDGVGNLLGWDPQRSLAILWNPGDGTWCSKEGSIVEVWQFILGGYGTRD